MAALPPNPLSPPLSPPLTRRATVALLAAMAVATVMGLLAWGPVGLSGQAHGHADARSWAGIPNAANVLTHLPLLPLGLWGLWRLAALRGHDALRPAWALFFVCQMLATVGGMAYHWAPGDAMLVWDQMPKSAACALMSCAFLAERVDARWGRPWVLAGALVLAAMGGVWWLVTLRLHGMGDLRPLLWLEFMPTLLVAAGAWTLSGSLLTRGDWMRSLLSFVVAQAVDLADAAMWAASGERLSGHSVRHLALAACVGWIAYRLAHAQGDNRGDGSAPATVRARAAAG